MLEANTPPLADALVRSSDDAIIALTLDGVVTSCNPAAERLYGVRAEEMVGRRLCEMVPDDLQDAETRRIARVVAGETQRAPNTVRMRRDGVRVVVSSSMFPVRDERQRVVSLGLMEQDVTEQLARQAGVLQAKRMDVVSRLAGGVAQEFNNINTAILGLADFIAPHVGAAEARADLDDIAAQAMRGARLAAHLLALSGERDGVGGPVSVNDSLRAMEPLLQRLVSERVWLTLDLGETDPVTLADQGQLELVMFELLMKASDTIGGLGTITVRTREVALDAGASAAGNGIPAGSYAEISVQSVRSVESAANAGARFDRLDDADFADLGTTMIASSLQRVGGYVATKDAGSFEATIYLPLAAERPVPAPAASIESVGDEVVLLVEDEAGVRNVIARALRDRGYQVLEAQNGEDALNVAAAHAAPLDLVISDVVMPQMDGRALHDQLRSWYPGIRFLFVSGYTRGALATAQLTGPVTEFLAKPFRMDALADATRRLLDRRARSAYSA